jgi:hypothetical protein
MDSARRQRFPVRLLHAGVLLFCFGFGGGRLFAQCPSDLITCSKNGDQTPLNVILNEYGALFEDADGGGPACAASAASRLAAKLDAAASAGQHWDPKLQRNVGPFQGWLEGANVALAFATALRIGGQDLMTPALDSSLQRVRDLYLQLGGLAAVDRGCGFKNGKWASSNTCMDDYTVAADAYGWIAAYEYRAGRTTNATTAANLAACARDSALSDTLPACAKSQPFAPQDGASICVFDPSKPFDPSKGPCNGAVGDLGPSKPNVVVVSLNHSSNPGVAFENIAYGLGLMPLIAGSHLGLHVANSGLVFDGTQQKIAQALLREGQAASDSQGNAFLSNCLHFSAPNNVLPGFYCTDGQPQDCSTLPVSQYACPKMYRLDLFYTNHLGGVPPSSLYRFDAEGPVFRERDKCDSMGIGRRILFQTLAYDWFVSTPALRAMYDGYLATADCQAVTGWAWDSTQPNTPINVDIYDGSTRLATVAANIFRPDLAGKGDQRHGFSWTVPASLKNGLPHSIWVRFGGTGTPLGNTPASISCTAPLSCTSVGISPTPPVSSGTTLTFTANCTGGVAPLQYNFWLYNVTTATFVANSGYSTSKTWSWTPTSSQTGTWNVGVWVKNNGSTAQYDTIVSTPNFQVTVPPPLSCSSVGISPTPPVVTGTTLTFTANCGGGVAPLQYNFWLYNVGTGTFVASSNYNTSRTWSWTPSSGQTGTWNVGVWVKSNGSTAQYDTIVYTANFVVNPAPLSCTSVSILPAPPVRYGTTLTFTTNCTAGVTPLQYQFWLYNVTTAQYVSTTGYITSKSWSWTPSASQVATWSVGVWVKNANSTAQYDTIVGTPNFNVTN